MTIKVIENFCPFILFLTVSKMSAITVKQIEISLKICLFRKLLYFEYCFKVLSKIKLLKLNFWKLLQTELGIWLLSGMNQKCKIKLSIKFLYTQLFVLDFTLMYINYIWYQIFIHLKLSVLMTPLPTHIWRPWLCH